MKQRSRARRTDQTRSMLKADAYVASRVLCRLSDQAERAFIFGRMEDAIALIRLKGKLESAIFGFDYTALDDPLLVGKGSTV